MGGSMLGISPTVGRGRGSILARRSIGPALLSVLLCLGTSVAQQTGSSAKNPLSSLLGNKTAAPKEQPAPPAAPAATSVPVPIPLPDVAMRAEDLMRLLRDVSSQLPSREDLEGTKATLDAREAPLREREKEVAALLAGSPSTLELREQETYWYAASTEGATMRRQLLDWANAAQSAMQQLSSLQPEWTATLQENQATPDLDPTLNVIRDAVKNIQATKAKAQDQLRLIVNLQVTAAHQHQLALDMMDQLARAKAQVQGRILQRDTLPLWQVFLRRQQGETPDFFRNISVRIGSVKSFIREKATTFTLLSVLLLLSLFLAYRARAATRGLQPAEETEIQILAITRHWIALGLLPPLLLSFLLEPLAPLPLIGLAILLSFFSIIVLLPPLIEPRFRNLLYWLVAVYVFNAMLNWLLLSPESKREVQFAGSVAAVVLFGWLLRPARISMSKSPGREHKVLVVGARVALAVMALSQLANFFGYFKLAQFLGVLCIYSTFIAVAVYTGFRVFSLLLVFALNRPAAERLAMVRLHKAAIIRWVPRILLKWVGFLIWLGATLDLLGVRAPVHDFIAGLLQFNIAGATGNITLGSVLAFWAILILGFALSTALRFLLREEVLRRLHLKRGIPELISTTLHYLLLLLVFLFAISAGGVALNKFTVITGALGVGVGFGLQNIINNFVSGLILQFERPIRLNDVLDVDGTTGTVTRIGIRSSTVQTFQGAEVIIPNANFISGKVINWTLSEAKRRIDLPVGVAYGTDPKLVKEMLERPAIQHPDVLTSPEPEAFFMDFGDSALNFELRFWMMQDSNTVKVKSEVALEVMRLLDEAGIEIPFPQRDLRLRSVDPAAAELLSPDGPRSDKEPEPEEHRKSRAVGER